MDFPSSPTVGQQYSVSGGPTYSWDGAKWVVLTPGNQFNRTTFTATAGQTVFSVTYTIGTVDVFRNGVKLVSGSDFTAIDGATITLANAATVGDTIEVIAYSQVVYATAAKAEDVYSVVRGMKNRIINGDMRIDQRNAGGSVTITSDNQYVIDRWCGGAATSSKFSLQRNAGSVTPPAGFSYYLGATSLSSYSNTSEWYGIRQAIEGFNISDLAWGTANAKAVTLSFWARSSLTGTFSGSIINASYNRCYCFTYSLPSANTWTFVTVSIPGDTSGTWATENSIGASIIFNLGNGALQSSGSANTWVAGGSWGVSGSQSVVGTNGATFYITGVQLEVGTVTNPVFERRLYGLELSLCQRYYEKSYDLSVVPGTNTGTDSAGAWVSRITGLSNGANIQRISHAFRVHKCYAPTVTMYSTTGASGKIRDRSNSSDVNGGPVGVGMTQFGIESTPSSSTTANFFEAHWTASAEL